MVLVLLMNQSRLLENSNLTNFCIVGSPLLELT
jgi:hypothetical protein